MSQPPTNRFALLMILLAALFSHTLGFAQGSPGVQAFSPSRYSMNSAATQAITVQFDQAMDAGTIVASNFVVYADRSGFHAGTPTYDAGSQTATFVADEPFEAGEMVTVVLTQGIQSQTATPLASSFLWSFFIRSVTGTADLTLDSAYSVGDGPHYVGVGDLNGDTHLDLVVPHSRSSKDAYNFLNQSDGNFSLIGVIGVGDLARAATLADVDSDTDLDVAVSNEGSNSIIILNNNGTGTLTAGTPIALGSSPAYITNADLNGDGHLDLVTVNGASDNISVLLNNGNGTFGAETQFAVGLTPQWAFIADFDNDGSLDVVVSNQGDDTISLLTNNGSGTLSVPANFSVGDAPRALDGRDFNGDGLIDVALTNKDASTASVLLNTGGSFSAPTDFPVGQEPFALTAGDFDGDWDADFVVVNKTSNDMYVLLNNGTGFFQIDSVYAVGSGSRGINSGDFDGDGVLDIGVANYDADSLQIFFNEFTIPPNRAPDAPVLASPSDLTFINPDSGQVSFAWNVPADFENDPLHFKLEISQTSDFSSPDFTFDSSLDGTGFSPALPVDNSTPSVSFDFNSAIGDGRYWWRVTAWDGELFSAPSGARRFTIDTTLPNLDNVAITSATFQPNWYNQGNTSSIDFGAQYDEGHALRADFNLGSLGGPQSVAAISSGQDQTVQLPVTLTGASDGTYSLSVTVVDSVGNEASINTEIALDSTPPSGTVANSASVSASVDFEVTWDGTGTDGSGSGLSGVYDVRVRVDGGGWLPWRTNFAGTSDTFQGAHGSTYQFEARAQDNLGNLEPFASIAEAQTSVDTTANDVTPPAAPLSLTASGASPSPWQDSSEFEVIWQPPTDQSGIARALYKLGSAPAANMDTTGSLNSGTTLTVTATQEDGQNFYLWFEDQRGNVDFNNHGVVLMRYDGMAPDLVEIDVQNPALAPNWFNPTSTAKAEVEINYDEKRMQQIRLDSESLATNVVVTEPASGDDVFHLFDLVIQGKPDGDHKLTITLVDSAGNSAEDSTNIRLDGTPPTGTLANSPDTSEAVTFLVTWSGSGTDGNGTGISGTYDVRYQVNGGVWQTWKSNFTGISDMFTMGVQDSTYGFEAASYDLLGNREVFTGTAESMTIVDTGFRDNIPPSIQHTPELMVDEGTTVSIQAQIADNIGIMQATLFYRNSGETLFQSKQMIDQGSDLFEVDIAAEEVPLSGLNYYISAFDGVNFSFHPSINWDTLPNNLSVRILGTESQGLARVDPLPGGDQSSFFRMISVPLNLDDADPLAVLRDDLGSYNPKNWRLFQYKPATESYSEYPDVDPFAPGKAFWLIVREPDKVVDSGVGTTVATNQPFTITLRQGWNDIALPYNFPVDWNDIQIVQGTVDDIMGPYTYQEEWLLPSQLSTLFPWEGYAVFSQTDGVQLQIEPVANLSQSAQKIAKAADWEIGLEAFCGESHDRPNFLGVAEDASGGWDNRDYLEPLHIGEFVSLSFPHEDWNTFRGRFTTDFRSQFDDGQVWQFEVSTNIPNEPVTLTFRNMSALPPGLQAILLDKETLQQVKLGPDATYEFEMTGPALKREFDLIIGTEEYIRDSEDLHRAMPNSFFLSQNFPNPFNAGTSLSYHVPEATHVTIQVLNILGQEVRELLSEKRSPGTYRIKWDGRTNDGKDISTGIYLVRFEAENFRQIRKITLIR